MLQLKERRRHLKNIRALLSLSQDLLWAFPCADSMRQGPCPVASRLISAISGGHTKSGGLDEAASTVRELSVPIGQEWHFHGELGHSWQSKSRIHTEGNRTAEAKTYNEMQQRICSVCPCGKGMKGDVYIFFSSYVSVVKIDD